MLIWSDNGEVRVQLVDREGVELTLPNVILDITLYMSGVRRYSFSGGATDPTGVCSIRLKNVTNQLLENRKLFLMDYNTPLQDCDDEVGISAPSATELARRLSSVKEWFPEDLDEFTSKLEKSNNHQIESQEQKIKILPGMDVHNMRYICDIVLN